MFFCGEESGVQSRSGFELSDIEIKLYSPTTEVSARVLPVKCCARESAARESANVSRA